MKDKVKTTQVINIENLIKEIIDKDNYLIIDIIITGGNEKEISIFLYHNDNDMINVDRLGKISKKIYPLLETLKFLNDGFSLEVSSPGIFREFKYINEFDIFKYKKIKITMINNEKIIAVSKGLDNDNNQLLKITIENEDKKINVEEIKSAQLFDFN